MTLLLGVLTLPFLLWSWLLGRNEEDGELAVSLICWFIILGTALGAGWWALS